MKTKTITMLHTIFPIVGPLTEIFRSYKSEAELQLYNIVDDGIVPRIQAAGGMIPPVLRTVLDHVSAAERLGADAVLITCSSLSEAADLIQPLVKIPVVKIDDAMTDEAVRIGGRIGVVATTETTIGPTTSQIKKKAAALGKMIEIQLLNCPEAYEAMRTGDADRHDRLVLAAIQELLDQVDLVVLAQASLARLAPRLTAKTSAPILTSPESGVRRVLERVF